MCAGGHGEGGPAAWLWFENGHFQVSVPGMRMQLMRTEADLPGQYYVLGHGEVDFLLLSLCE